MIQTVALKTLQAEAVRKYYEFFSLQNKKLINVSKANLLLITGTAINHGVKVISSDQKVQAILGDVLNLADLTSLARLADSPTVQNVTHNLIAAGGRVSSHYLRKNLNNEISNIKFGTNFGGCLLKVFLYSTLHTSA